jgi:lipopolysaccharide assembly protein A
MKRLARFLLFLLLVLVLLAGFVFTLNNTTAVPLWLGTDLNPKPLSVWMLLAFAAGGLLGLLLGLGLLQRVRHRLEVRQLRARVRQLELEASVLRQPASHEHGAAGGN